MNLFEETLSSDRNIKTRFFLEKLNHTSLLCKYDACNVHKTLFQSGRGFHIETIQ